MSIELRPLGVSCNLGCHYCYQNPQRQAGNVRQSYDLERMKEAVERLGGPLTLFGGEPLLMEIGPLEELLAWSYERFGSNTLQTNGALIEEEHLELFRSYNVRLGISIDGPGELNDARWDRSLEQTRATTARIEETIERLAADPELRPGLIVTLHRGNAASDKLPRLGDWFRRLDGLGIRSVRIHVLEVDEPRNRDLLALSERENVEALLYLVGLQGELDNVRFDIVAELEGLLMGQDSEVSCVWRACDPYTTEAVQGVEGNGQSSNCGRTNKDGVDFTKSDEVGYERYIALHATPQEAGGCQGCRFFMMCKGQCPGTAIDNDWRNRTEHCKVWMTLFTEVERRLVTRGRTPLTLMPERAGLEASLVEAWRDGRNPSLSRLLSRGDHRRRVGRRTAESPVGPGPEWPGARYLDFQLPAFARWSWANEDARAIWLPRLDAVRAELARLSVVFVAEGLAPAAVRDVYPDEYLEVARTAARHDLATLLLERGQGTRESGRRPGQRSRTPLPDGVPRLDTLAIGSPRKVAELQRLFAERRYAEVDELLDYPSRPRAWAARVFDEQGSADAIWAMATSTPGAMVSEVEAQVAENPASNLLLEALGLVPVPFQPTSFDCPDARAYFERLLELGRATGDGRAVEWLYEALRWPAEWTALHGIAEIKTPVLKISRTTDATSNELTVRYLGRARVEGAARGLGFPYSSRDGLVALGSRELRAAGSG